MIDITFPGGVAVNANFDGFTVASDQPKENGGQNAAPSPFKLFLASIGTCAGFYAASFCQQREIDMTGMHITLDTKRNSDTHRLDQIKIIVHLPDGFPEKYRATLLRVIDQCTVKKAIFDPPEFSVETI
jgi:ribosomal protein S12 methylthiotransferase accessory factor